MLGIGVMLAGMSDNTESVYAFKSSLGKEIYDISLQGENDLLVIRFVDHSMLEIRDVGQSCCESRYMTIDDNLAEFKGSKLVGAEIADADSIEDGGEVHDVQFLKLATDRGIITVSNHNEHNGYYGGFAIVCARGTWKQGQE